MEGSPSLNPADALVVLGALARHDDRSLMVIRPIVHEGSIVDGTLVWFSRAALAANPEFAHGRRMSEAMGPRTPQHGTVQAVVAAFRTPGVSVCRGPFPVVHDGETRHLVLSVIAEGELLILEYEDVTETVATQAAAANSEIHFRTLLDGLDAGVVLLRPTVEEDDTFADAEIVWTNVASRRMWLNQEGLKPGTRVSDVYYDRVDWLAAANEAWRGSPVTRVLAVNPDVAPWTSATETLRRIGDVIVEQTIDRTHDQQLLERLTDLDERFATLIEDLPLTVLVARVGTDELTFVSPNAERLTGHPLNRLRLVSQWETLVHPDDRHIRDHLVDELVRNGQCDGILRYRRADGSTFPAALRMVRRQNSRGADGFITLLTDVSEQQRMRERIESGDRLETLGRTAGSIAHDFNNLLMIVAGSIDRAQRQLQTDNLALETAGSAAKRAADLATNLLSFARGRPGALRAIDAGRLIRDFEPILRGVVYPKVDVIIEIDDAHDLHVFADTTHLEQIVLNLVTNARDASADRGVVDVQVRRVEGARCHLIDGPGDGTHVAISVRDRGPGVPPTIAARIWEPFFSAKTATDDSGTGLGLSTVHGIAHQHGGHVHLDSHPDRGTTFTVYLPLHPAGR